MYMSLCMIIMTFLRDHELLYYVFLDCNMKKDFFYVIGSPYISNQAGVL